MISEEMISKELALPLVFKNTCLASSRKKLKRQRIQTWRRHPYLHNKTPQVSSQPMTLAGAEELPVLFPKQADNPCWEWDQSRCSGAAWGQPFATGRAASRCWPQSSSTWKYLSALFSWQVQSQVNCQRRGEGPCGGVCVPIHGVSVGWGQLSTRTSLQEARGMLKLSWFYPQTRGLQLQCHIHLHFA